MFEVSSLGFRVSGAYRDGESPAGVLAQAVLVGGAVRPGVQGVHGVGRVLDRRQAPGGRPDLRFRIEVLHFKV